MPSRAEPYQGTPAWLAERRSGFGASDAPTLIDGDEMAWNALMLRKLDILPEREASETMELGKRIEPVIRALAAERISEPIIRDNRIRRHPEHPIVMASLDGRRKRGGQPVELKKWGWATDEFGPNGSDIVPLRMLYQVEQQLAVTGHDTADLFVLFAAVELRHYRIGRDGSMIDELLTLELAAWEYIARGEVPPWPGPAPERPQLKADEIAADPEITTLVTAHEALARDYDSAERALTDVKDQLRRRLVDVGGARGALPDGRTFSVSHRPNRDGEVIAWEPIAAGYRKRLIELGVPEADLDFVTTALTTTRTGARPLRVSIGKEKKEKAAA